MISSTNAKNVATNTFYQILGKAVSMSVTVLVTLIVTNYFGRQAYGEFSLMQNWPALFFIIVDFGLNAVVVRELSKNWELADKYIGNVLLFRLVFSILLILFLLMVLSFFPYSADLKLGIALSLLLILTQSLYATGNIVFQCKLRYDLSTYSYLLGYIVILLVVWLAVLFKWGVAVVSFSYVIGGLTTFIVGLKQMRALGVIPDLTFDKTTFMYFIKESLPLGLMFVFSQINFKSDALLLSALPLPNHFNITNTDAVALYALPYKVFEVALVVPTFFMNAVYPILVTKINEGREKLKSIFSRIISFLFIASLAGSLIGFLVSPIVVTILGGEVFGSSVNVLRILMAGLGLYFLTQPISWLVVALGKQKYLPIVYLTSALVNISLNVVLIPKYSYYASAVITHVSEFVILVGLVIVTLKSWKEYYVLS